MYRPRIMGDRCLNLGISLGRDLGTRVVLIPVREHFNIGYRNVLSVSDPFYDDRTSFYW